ncbi:MAG: type II secretion system protein [Planctomycetia bacterium]|nr:type II secretion system protein [Planctomycetia bacterium]
MKRLTKNKGSDGFTLVELLMVIVIIAMLGTISISVLRASLESAKIAQTQTTINKIDSIITVIYEKYQYRKMDMSTSPTNTAFDRERSRIKLLRDLMRMDMPCNYDEITGSAFGQQQSALSQSYQVLRQFYEDEKKKNPKYLAPADIVNAELLYLVVTNGDPDSRSMFTEREIGDVNGNGFSEFVDAWGRPIQWLRWAPGLPESDRQTLVGQADDNDSDPLDPLNAGEKDPDQGIPGWFLAPFVVSGGPDGVIGLEMGETLCNNSPFSASSLSIGAEKDSPDGSYHDNIHNHTLVR